MAHDPVVPLPDKPNLCPICGKVAAATHRPFCSARCTDIDLGRWLKGNYRVETEELPEEPSADSGKDD